MFKRLLCALLAIVFSVNVLACYAIEANATDDASSIEYHNNQSHKKRESVYRIYGSNRFETAIKVADKLKRIMKTDKFDAIVLARGNDFADALSGSYLSAVKNAPILLTGDSDAINSQVVEYIKNNLSTNGMVYILGEENAVPNSIDKALNNFNVKRLSGKSRFETNLQILNEAGVGDNPILICTSDGFADSLSVSACGLPILLVKDSLTDAQRAFLGNLNGNDLYIIGGAAAVSEELALQVAKYGNTTRIGGRNRFETSVLIAETFFENPRSVVLTYANNYPDGLCGGPLAFSLDAPLILTIDNNETEAVKYINENKISSGYVLGGTALISNNTVDIIFNKENTSDNEEPLGAPISLQIHVPDITDYLGYPTEDDFGEYFEQAVILYQAISSCSESIKVAFPIEWESEHNEIGKRFKFALETTADFIDTFSLKILRNFFNFKFDTYSIDGSGLTAITRADNWHNGIVEKMGMTDPSIYYDANISAGLVDGMSSREAITKITEWICNNLEFAPQPDPVIALSEGEGSCAAYSKLFLAMCQSANIDCQYVTGCIHTDAVCGGQGCHAWNKVKIDDTWYYIDLLWVDQCCGSKNYSNCQYFLTENLWSDHTAINMVFG